MKRKFSVILSIAMVMAILFSSVFVFAHAMIIETVEEGKVKVVFDDGSPNRHAEVTVFDEEENEIAHGEVDEEGYFSYDPTGAVLLVAQDNMGHRAEYVVGEGMRRSLPRVPTIGAALLIFALVAVVFRYRSKKRSVTE